MINLQNSWLEIYQLSSNDSEFMGEIADYMRNDLIDNDEKDRKDKRNEKGLKLEEFNSVLKAKINPKRQKQPSQSDVAANFNVKAESFVPKKPTRSSRIETKLFEIDTKKIPYDVLRKNCEKNYKKSNFEDILLTYTHKIKF